MAGSETDPDISAFVADHAGEAAKAASYKKHWRLYDLWYVLSVFVYVATIAVFLAVLFDTATAGRSSLFQWWGGLTGVGVVGVALLAGSGIFFVLYTLYHRGKTLSYDSIDVLEHELAVAIQHFENDDTYNTVRALQTLKTTAKNEPPLPFIPVPRSPPPFYHKVVVAIDEYVDAVQVADDVSESLEETFPRFAADLIVLLETKQSLYAEDWGSEIERSDEYETSYLRLLRRSVEDTDFLDSSVVVVLFLFTASAIGLVSFWYNENFGVAFVSLLLTGLEVYTTKLHSPTQ